MLLGYNTNGLAHHDPLEAIDLLAGIGYRSVALTIDHGLLNPFSEDLPAKIEAIKQRLAKHNMRSVIETGARFLLNPRVKHEPTLMTPNPVERNRRTEFLCNAIDIAKALGSDCVSFWSGIVQGNDTDEVLLERLSGELRHLIDYAGKQQVTLAFEPEPGMYIDTMSSFERLFEQLDAADFRLTLDLGHLHCLGETPIADYIRRFGKQIANIHLEDMRAAVHEHLMFGEGEIDFPPIIDALAEVGYQGGVHVELSRHSHEGPTAARRAFDFLNPLIQPRES